MMPPPEPTIAFNKNANHAKFINPADVHRRDPLESRFSAYHKGKLHTAPPRKKPLPGMAGVSPAVAAKNSGGLGATMDKVISTPVQIALGVTALVVLPGVIKAWRSTSPKKEQSTLEDILKRTSPV